MASVLTPLQLTAGTELLQNTGFGVSANLTLAIDAYTTSNVMSPLIEAIGLANGNVGNTTLLELQSIGNTTCPALGDSVPASSSLVVTPTPPGLTGLVTLQAEYDTGNNVSKYIQALSAAQGYAEITNQFINSAVNSQTYLANTFTNTNNMVTGDITSVNQNTKSFGSDLANLGKLINLSNLGDLGSPLALTKQLAAVGSLTPALAFAFNDAGVPIEVVVNINSPTLSVTDSVQKQMYTAMTKITGTNLTEILSILKVKTSGIDTMADLLNPYKIFPNSFQTLTVTNLNGVSENIYLNSQGTVNMAVVQGLPTAVISL